MRDPPVTLCEKRLLICDECWIEYGFAYNSIRRWTSEAPISMNGLTGYLCQTSVIVSHHIPLNDMPGSTTASGGGLWSTT